MNKAELLHMATNQLIMANRSWDGTRLINRPERKEVTTNGEE